MGKEMALLKRARSLLREFAVSRRGNVAMMFGIALVPLMIAAGAGLDYARAALVRSQMADALDAASLAVGSTTGLDRAKAEALAKKYFEANYQGDTSNGKPQVTIGTNDYNSQGSVKVTASYTMPTMLLKVIGANDMHVSASSTTVWGQSKLWVSLVLDNSLSMNEGSPTTKIDALQDAAKKLLVKLKTAAATPGDVKVGIVPFTNLVRVDAATNVDKSWIYWGEWEAEPANFKLDGLKDNTGPGSACPFTDGDHGFHCQSNPTNGSSSRSTIATTGTYTGYICPSMDSGSKNTDRYARYYNGCWTSAPTQTKTEVRTDTTPVWTKRRKCTQTGSNTPSCNGTSNLANYPAATTVPTTAPATYTTGYTGDSVVVGQETTDTSTEYYQDGSKSCSNNTCTWTRFYYNKKTKDTTTKTAAGPWLHAWVKNAHSTWTGCIMDRAQNDDVANTAPAGSSTTGFPASNDQHCGGAKVTVLEKDWTATDAWSTLNTKIDGMDPEWSTNQPIGVAHGMQMLTPGDPYGTPAVPANTARYIILFSDGLNTQNRWWNDINLMSTGSPRINARMTLVCDAAKAAGITIYSVYVHIGGLLESPPMENCASDAGKYYNLTSADQIDAAFQDIAQKITNVRIAQ
jgi:Flp pilus assembly protein TadG